MKTSIWIYLEVRFLEKQEYCHGHLGITHYKLCKTDLEHATGHASHPQGP